MTDIGLYPLFDSCKVASYKKVNLSRRQQEVYDALSQGRATIWELATRMNRPINQVVGRLTELKDKEKVRIVDYKFNTETKKENAVYEVAPGS